MAYSPMTHLMMILWHLNKQNRGTNLIYAMGL